MKIKRLYFACFGLAIFSVFLTSCEFPRSYGTMFRAGIYPISPQMGYSFVNRYQTIDTLIPAFKWKDLKSGNQTYELGVWETPYRSVEDVKKKSEQIETSWGTLVFTTNNIATNCYPLPIPLKPDTFYNWSVRICDGEKAGDWSSFSQQRAVLNVVSTHSGVPFGFKTPAQ